MPVTIYGGIRRSLFEGVDRVYLGGETIALRDAEGRTLIGASVLDVAPLVIQNPAIQPANAVLGDTITLSLGLAEGDPAPLPYLDSPANQAQGAFDIQLQVGLRTPRMAQAGQGDATICRTSYRHAYWTIAQMLAHHTVNGCNLQPGDLLGSGTLSGPTLDQAGALIELTTGGKNPVQLPGGGRRVFREDGDAVVIRGWCEKPGAARVGFGECWGTVLPAL